MVHGKKYIPTCCCTAGSSRTFQSFFYIPKGTLSLSTCYFLCQKMSKKIHGKSKVKSNFVLSIILYYNDNTASFLLLLNALRDTDVQVLLHFVWITFLFHCQHTGCNYTMNFILRSAISKYLSLGNYAKKHLQYFCSFSFANFSQGLYCRLINLCWNRTNTHSTKLQIQSYSNPLFSLFFLNLIKNRLGFRFHSSFAAFLFNLSS